MVMDGMPGLIHSGDDFGVNSAGIMITETTISQFNGFDPGGIPEFVIDGQTGLLFTPGRPDELAAGLERMFGAPALRHELAAAARANVVAHHTLEARADALAGIYRSVAGCGAGRGGTR